MYDHLENFVRRATQPERIEENDYASDNTVEKLAQVLDQESGTERAELSIAKLLVSLDILSS